MNDWEELRQILAETEECNNNYGVLTPMFEGCFISRFRECETEDDFADRLEAEWYHCISHNILTADILHNYRNFFNRHGLAADLESAKRKMIEDYRQKEEAGQFSDSYNPAAGQSDYRSDCRRIRKEIGRQIRDERLAKGYDMSYLSEISGIDEGMIARIEAGRANAEIDTIAALAKTLNTQIIIYG